MTQAFNSFLKWVSKSFSDSGEVSGRRLTAFSVNCVYLFGRIWFIVTNTDAYYLLLGLLMDALYVLLLFGIVTFQQITEFKNGKRETDTNPK
jgi:hypothetical protein